MNNENKPQEVPQVKSVEAHAEEMWDKHSEYIDDSLSSMDSIAGSSVIASRYKFLRAAKDISEPLVNRIAELEKQNAVYREALDKIERRCKNRLSVFASNTRYIAKQALNPKDNG